MAGSGALISYAFLKNPNWLKLFRMHPFTFLGLFTLYAAFNKDRAAIGGMSMGWLAFLMAL